MIRNIVVAIPLSLLALVLVSFFSASSLSHDKENAMFIGSLAEASNLNPILSTDASSSQVSGLIFQGLLTTDEDVNLKGELAESWELSQLTTFFFSEPGEASAARETIQEMVEGHGFAGAGEEACLDALFVRLAEPGMDFSSELAAQIAGALPIKRAAFRLPDRNAEEVLEAINAMDSESASNAAGSVVRVYQDGPGYLEVAVAGRGWWEKFFQEHPEWEELAMVEDEGTFLAEPEVRFVLRENVRWQDGAPFTSRDVEFTYQSIMDDSLASPRKPDFMMVGELQTLGDYEVLVRYRKPYSPALNSWRMSIIPAHILEGRSRDWWAENFNRRPVGTGPYQLGEWRSNEFLRLERNPDFWKAPGPWLDAVVFRVLPDPLTLRLAFETNQVDFWAVDPWAVSAFIEDPRFQVFRSPSSSYTYVGWNLRRPLFQDLTVRRALAHAVNVEQMIEFVLYGYGMQSTGIFTPLMWFFDPEIQPITHDPAKAEELFREAGWERGRDGVLAKDGKRFSFTLITNNANEVRRDVATLIQDDLRRVGIEVRIELYEWAVFIANFVQKADFDAMVLGWSLPQDDFDQYQIWHSSQTAPERLNVVGYENPKVDALLEEIRQEYNRERIMEIASQLQSIIYEDQPYLFLFVPEGTSVMWKDAYRVCRPGPDGTWIDEPVRNTKAGWTHYLEWFYRPEYTDRLPEDRIVKEPATTELEMLP